MSCAPVGWHTWALLVTAAGLMTQDQLLKALSLTRGLCWEWLGALCAQGWGLRGSDSGSTAGVAH